MGATKPDPYDFCFGCEYCNSKQIMLWREYFCTFNCDINSVGLERLIKRLDKCPKENGEPVKRTLLTGKGDKNGTERFSRKTSSVRC